MSKEKKQTIMLTCVLRQCRHKRAQERAHVRVWDQRYQCTRCHVTHLHK